MVVEIQLRVQVQAVYAIITAIAAAQTVSAEQIPPADAQATDLHGIFRQDLHIQAHVLPALILVPATLILGTRVVAVDVRDVMEVAEIRMHL